MPQFLILTADRKPWKNKPDYVASHPGSEELEWVIDWVPTDKVVEAMDAHQALIAAVAYSGFPRHSIAVQEKTEYARHHQKPDPLYGNPSTPGRRFANSATPRRAYSPR